MLDHEEGPAGRESRRPVQVVAAPEEIDIANAAGFEAALVAAASGGHSGFVADMSRTRFCDSSGISALVIAQRHALQEDSRLVLAVSPVVLRLLTLTGLDGVIPHFATLEEALGHATTDGSPSLNS